MDDIAKQNPSPETGQPKKPTATSVLLIGALSFGALAFFLFAAAVDSSNPNEADQIGLITIVLATALFATTCAVRFIARMTTDASGYLFQIGETRSFTLITCLGMLMCLVFALPRDFKDSSGRDKRVETHIGPIWKDAEDFGVIFAYKKAAMVLNWPIVLGQLLGSFCLAGIISMMIPRRDQHPASPPRIPVSESPPIAKSRDDVKPELKPKGMVYWRDDDLMPDQTTTLIFTVPGADRPTPETYNHRYRSKLAEMLRRAKANGDTLPDYLEGLGLDAPAEEVRSLLDPVAENDPLLVAGILDRYPYDLPMSEVKRHVIAYLSGKESAEQVHHELELEPEPEDTPHNPNKETLADLKGSLPRI